MADYEEIKNRFAERVKARQAEGAIAGAEEAERVDLAFAPLKETIRAITDAVAEMRDTNRIVRFNGITQGRDGFHEAIVYLNCDGSTRQVVVRHGAYFGGGYQLSIQGLTPAAAKTLHGAGNTPTAGELAVPDDRAHDIAAALEACAEEVYGAP